MKNKPRLPDDAILLARLGKKNIPDLIRWLDDNRLPTENIDVHQWVDDFWYVVVVKETPDEKYPDSVVIGFTVDINDDFIFWSRTNSQTHRTNEDVLRILNHVGGNCFCRKGRWWNLMCKQYPDANKDTVYDYRPPRKVREHVS